MRSATESDWAGSMRTESPLTTRNPTGCTDTPAPLPPAKGNSAWGMGCLLLSGKDKSPPAVTYPKLTLEMGMMVAPEVATTGSPMTVFTSTMSLMEDMAVCISSPMG